ncbi:hypothetical protein BY458DRAFT_591370 [Sporodiniella umbellata]|nr:hypothetical protein BY458DRAFT_591370 [Sporodiniella umbellata]
MNPLLYSNIEQATSFYEPNSPSKQIRSMPIGNERLAALKDLGVTFNEGTHRVTKIATPSGTPTLPSFVDADQIESLLLKEQQKQQKRKYYTDDLGILFMKEDDNKTINLL